MLSQEFIDGLCERIPLAGLPVFLTFRTDAPAWRMMVYLLAFEINLITVDRDHPHTQQALKGKDFDQPGAARTVRVCLLAKPEIKTTMFKRITKFLESVAPAEQHALSKLCSTAEAERQTVAHFVMERWGSSDVDEQLAANELKLQHDIVQENGFYMLRLTLEHRDAKLVHYYLDGWSGLLRRDGLWQRHQLVSRESLSRTILRDIRNAANDLN